MSKAWCELRPEVDYPRAVVALNSAVANLIRGLLAVQAPRRLSAAVEVKTDDSPELILPEGTPAKTAADYV
jgi:hypothetical protein